MTTSLIPASKASWVEVAPNSDFPIQNIPFGIFKTGNLTPRLGTAIGDHVVDLFKLATMGYFQETGAPKEVFAKDRLNDFIALGKPVTRSVRLKIAEVLDAEDPLDAKEKAPAFLYQQSEVEMLLPVHVGDYTDFYSSIEHARNVGSMFRDPENALLPNWLHLPVGYHGRASSIIVSGTPIHRPKGQQMPKGAETTVFGPCKLLDFELEMGFVIGKKTHLGQTVSIDQADDHIFGLVLFNDWSARDIQKWEYVPLGPFLGKSFASTISPWVVTLEALEPFRTQGPKPIQEQLPYLQQKGPKNYDLQLEVAIQPDQAEETTVCQSNFKYMYWSMCQQLAHHTVNGCNINIGDIMASGTISGPTKESYGSMLELSWRGTDPVKMNDGSERKFINDGDTVILKGFGQKDGLRIGFGEAKGKVLPAL